MLQTYNLNGNKSYIHNWDDIKITQENNSDNITIDAGNNIEVNVQGRIAKRIDTDNIEAQCILRKNTEENGVVDDITIIPMRFSRSKDDETQNIHI